MQRGASLRGAEVPLIRNDSSDDDVNRQMGINISIHLLYRLQFDSAPSV